MIDMKHCTKAFLTHSRKCKSVPRSDQHLARKRRLYRSTIITRENKPTLSTIIAIYRLDLKQYISMATSNLMGQGGWVTGTVAQRQEMGVPKYRQQVGVLSESRQRPKYRKNWCMASTGVEILQFTGEFQLLTELPLNTDRECQLTEVCMYQSMDVPKYGCTKVQMYQSTIVLKYECTKVRVYRSTNVPK